MDDYSEQRHRFQIAYLNGSDDEHSMDAEALGPALLAFAKLIQAANRELNTDRATVKLLVASNFEHKCFNINFEAIQTIYRQLKDLLDSGDFKNLHDLLQTIGIITTGSGTIVASLIGLLKLRKGRKVESIQEVSGSPHSLNLKIEGNNNVVLVDKDVVKLAQSKDVLQPLNGMLAPVRTGKETAMELRDDDKVTTVLDKQDVEEIISSCEQPIETIAVEEPEEPKPRTVTANLYSYGPVFDPKAPNWRFKYRGKPIYVEVKGTNIAKDAVKRRASFLDDRYRVRMEVTPPKTPDGDTHYRIIDVLDFSPADEQMPLPLRGRRSRGQRSRAKRS